MAKRQSAPAQPNSIQTQDDLIAKIARLGEIDRGIAAIEAEAETRIAEIQQHTEHACTDLVTEQKVIVKDVQAYCEVHKTTLLPKGKKSADLGVGVIGWRQNPPSVKLLRAAEEVVAELLATEDEADAELLRETYTLDKDAVLGLRTKRETVLAKMREPDADTTLGQATIDAIDERLKRYAADKLFRIVVGSEKFFVEPVSAKKATAEVAA